MSDRPELPPPPRALTQSGRAASQPPPYEPSPPARERDRPSRRDAPERPALVSPNAPPVLTKLPAPFTVRLSQFLWVLSFLVGAVSVVYLFVIREDQLPLIAEAVRGVSEGRPEETYTAAADIVYWCVFGAAVALLLIQITLLVSFSSRKPNVRWWQLATIIVQAVIFLLSLEYVAVGEPGETIRQLFVGQFALASLALLFSTFRGALAWSARRHDVRRSGGGDGGSLEI